MKKQYLAIEGIPAVLWGEEGGGLFIAVHGDQSDKEDAAIEVFAEAAARKGFGTLSFDLPENGARKGEGIPLTPQNAVRDLQAILAYARGLPGDIGLFGCSLGAYFAMLAYRDEALRQALFLSPVVDMRALIEGMMAAFGVSEERLQREGEVETPAKTLSWEYYSYVAAHPISWNTPTALLYGKRDTLSAPDVVHAFAKHTGAALTVWEDGEHYFHTREQLRYLANWLDANIAVI